MDSAGGGSMVSKSGINVPIYKLDLEALRAFFGDEIPLNEFPGRIVDSYNADKKDIVYESKGSALVSGSYVELFHNIKARPNASSWTTYFQGSGIDLPAIKTEFQHLICFTDVDEELYAYTAGQSAVVFERFVDISFPIEVGRRIAKPEVKSGRSSQITGTTLSSDLHFRDARRISHAESLDTVWTSLTGQMRAAVLADKTILSIFGAKSKMKIDVTGALRLGPKVDSPAKMIDLIRWMADQSEESLPSDDGWAALDTIKLLHPRKKKDLLSKLRHELAVQIFREGKFDDFALTHMDSATYANATRYLVKQKSEVLHDESYEPELASIVKSMKIDSADYERTLSDVTVETTNQDLGTFLGTSGSLLTHLNGELRHKGKTYFLLTGKWYEVDALYVSEITKDFVSLITSLDRSAGSIGLRPWRTDEHEGDYNHTSIASTTFINGDKILTDNVELFDTLSFAGTDELHILHVKLGFNVKIRDVRSQLLASAQIIENDLRTGGAKIRSHHAQLVLKGRTTLSEADFIELFERPRIYGLCYGTKLKVTESSLDNFRSNVARMELVALNNQFRQVSSSEASARLSLVWIPIVAP